MHPILISFGKVQIYSYGFFLALGVVVCSVLLLRQAEREGLDQTNLLDLIIITSIAGLLGSRLFYVFFYEWDYYRAHWWQILDLRNQGLVFYGAVVFGVGAAYLYLKKKRLSFWPYSDLFAPYLALGYAFGRIGCFLNGCCFGKPTSMPWGVVFPHLGDVPRHPTQLYSSIFAFIFFFWLQRLYRRRTFSGQVFLAYLIGYGTFRFVVEFFRENLVVWHTFTIGQITALGIVVVALVTYLVKKGAKEDL